jgi:hypothetical protein
MKLVDLKRPKKTKKQLNTEVVPMDASEDLYPYGLRINFDKAEIDKIQALKGIPAGAQVKVSAIGKVVEVSITDRTNNNKRHRVEIQLHKVGIEDQSKTKEAIFEEAIK